MTRNGYDKKNFQELYMTYYKALVSYANTFLSDLSTSEDVVQDVFLPTKYLVNAEGKIVDKVDDKKIEELLKEAYGF